jgi:hypothetical protein
MADDLALVSSRTADELTGSTKDREAARMRENYFQGQGYAFMIGRHYLLDQLKEMGLHIESLHQVLYFNPPLPVYNDIESYDEPKGQTYDGREL